MLGSQEQKERNYQQNDTCNGRIKPDELCLVPFISFDNDANQGPYNNGGVFRIFLGVDNKYSEQNGNANHNGEPSVFA